MQNHLHPLLSGVAAAILCHFVDPDVGIVSLSFFGTLIGALAAPFTGGASMAIGAGVDSAIKGGMSIANSMKGRGGPGGATSAGAAAQNMAQAFGATQSPEPEPLASPMERVAPGPVEQPDIGAITTGQAGFQPTMAAAGAMPQRMGNPPLRPETQAHFASPSQPMSEQQADALVGSFNPAEAAKNVQGQASQGPFEQSGTDMGYMAESSAPGIPGMGDDPSGPGLGFADYMSIAGATGAGAANIIDLFNDRKPYRRGGRTSSSYSNPYARRY